jgi:hypothetical protein
MTKREQMIKDISLWSHDKLQQWSDDSMMRYQLAGARYGEAQANIITSLLMAVCTLMATRTTTPVEEINAVIATMINSMREHAED